MASSSLKKVVAIMALGSLAVVIGGCGHQNTADGPGQSEPTPPPGEAQARAARQQAEAAQAAQPPPPRTPPAGAAH